MNNATAKRATPATLIVNPVRRQPSSTNITHSDGCMLTGTLNSVKQIISVIHFMLSQARRQAIRTPYSVSCQKKWLFLPLSAIISHHFRKHADFFPAFAKSIRSQFYAHVSQRLWKNSPKQHKGIVFCVKIRSGVSDASPSAVSFHLCLYRRPVSA